MRKPMRAIDSAIFLMNHFSEKDIELMKDNLVLDKKVQLAMEVKKCYDKYSEEKKMSRYACVGAELNLSVTYVIQLLKY